MQAIMHYGESIKAIGNEVGLQKKGGCVGIWLHVLRSIGIEALLLQEFGDGIMSAIDMFATVHTIEGKLGEKRMVITLNGKVRSPLCRQRGICRTFGCQVLQN